MRDEALRPAKTAAGKILLLLGGAAVAIVGLELVLQLAALFVGETRGSGSASTGAVRILCLGDSNTYGLAVEREESYPSRLENLWKERPDGSRIEVINLGFPGTNSSQVLRDFDRNLDLFDPEVVVVSIGANDFWTVPVPTSAAPQPLLARIRSSSRLYRLLYMATRDAPDDAAIVVTSEHVNEGRATLTVDGQVFELGHDRADWDPGAKSRLVDNLGQLVVRAKERGVRLVFLNYASAQGFYANASRRIESVAARTGTPLVDVNGEFRRSVCPKEPCPEWIFPRGSPAFDHPTARGYELVAKSVLAKLTEPSTTARAGTSDDEGPR